VSAVPVSCSLSTRMRTASLPWTSALTPSSALPPTVCLARVDDLPQIRTVSEKALTFAHEIKTAAPDQPVILTVSEMKRLARNAAELMTLSAQLQGGGVQLELLTGPLTGIYDPHGMGSMLFAVLAVATQLDRDYIREKTLEGQQAAAARGNHGGRPKVLDEDDVLFARAP
jgi:DNA invertase Pin-like site-specific DNA recombinase